MKGLSLGRGLITKYNRIKSAEILRTERTMQILAFIAPGNDRYFNTLGCGQSTIHLSNLSSINVQIMNGSKYSIVVLITQPLSKSPPHIQNC